MAKGRRCGEDRIVRGASGCVAVFLIFLTLLTIAPAPARAAVNALCRVPDAYLHFPTKLKRTGRLIDAKRAIRILVVGPAIEGPEVTERRHLHLAQALAQHLPGVQFVILDSWHGARVAEEDFDRLRGEVEAVRPDLILWEVGTADALASSDPAEFSGVLARAALWARERDIDFIFIDPPYLPRVGHETLYARMVGAISTVSRDIRANLFRRYASMQYLQRVIVKPGTPRPHCMSELLAEAILRAVTR
jgi:hypothetical protein